MLNSLVVLQHERQLIYIACEEMDFTWDERDAVEFDRMWEEGLCIKDIARAFDRDVDEVAILVIDRKRKGKIHDRPGGVLGKRMPIWEE